MAAPVASAGPAAADRIGELLLREGLISKEQLQKALEEAPRAARAGRVKTVFEVAA